MSRYPQELKDTALAAYLCGYTTAEISETYGVSRPTVVKWHQKWDAEFAGKTLADCSTKTIVYYLQMSENLKHKLDETTRKLEIIHESGVMQTIPRSTRVQLALSLADDYPISALCAAFEISLSSFYYHKKMDARRQKKKDALCSAIRQAFEESGGRYGSERIRIQLQKQGIRISQKQIICLMKEMNLTYRPNTIRYYASEDNAPFAQHYNVKIL